MSAVSIASEPLDRSSLEAMMIRWKLVEGYLSETAKSEEIGKMALHVLVSHDFPVLIRELRRLRPDFSSAEGNSISQDL
jgi:hypothetical protein